MPVSAHRFESVAATKARVEAVIRGGGGESVDIAFAFRGAVASARCDLAGDAGDEAEATVTAKVAGGSLDVVCE